MQLLLNSKITTRSAVNSSADSITIASEKKKFEVTVL